MKRLLGLLALLLLMTPAWAQQNVNPGIYEASPSTLIEGQKTPLLTDINRRLLIIAAGAAADNAPASGNSVPIACIHNTTQPSYSNGDKADVQCGSNGSISMTLMRQNSTSAVSTSSSQADDTTNNEVTLSVRSYGVKYDGSTWDRDFACQSSAVINVAAAATTQLVALSGSTVIRVCSFVLTGDTAATTATFVYGTGTNCGTGTTALTGAMRMVDEGNLIQSAGNGALFRGAAANALCLTAATGTVTGFVTYAQF